MSLWAKLRFWKAAQAPANITRGSLGEHAARQFLANKGLRFLAANFASRRGEIDLIFRDKEALVFVEVKARSSNSWTRPSRAVNARKRLALARTAHDYLRSLENPCVPYRFDIVEVVLVDSQVREVRHIENSFNTPGLRRPRR